MTAVVHLRARVSDAEMERRAKTAVTPDDMVIGVHGDADVYMPNGQLLVSLRTRAMDEALCERAFETLHYLRKYTTDNRSGYAGTSTSFAHAKSGKVMVTRKGRVKHTNYAVDANGKRPFVASATVGYFDRQGGRYPYCRQTAFTANEVDRWKKVVPLVGNAAELYAKHWPNQHGVHMRQARKCSPDFIIKGTPFSTLTVNNNVSGNVHRDKGDYKGGLGLISYHLRGAMAGGELVFPQYKVFVRLQDRDLLFFNPHEWHAVNPIVHLDPAEEGKRISVVYYLRQRMEECHSAKEENARAKRRGQL